eukprot:515997_1
MVNGDAGLRCESCTCVHEFQVRTLGKAGMCRAVYLMFLKFVNNAVPMVYLDRCPLAPFRESIVELYRMSGVPVNSAVSRLFLSPGTIRNLVDQITVKNLPDGSRLPISKLRCSSPACPPHPPWTSGLYWSTARVTSRDIARSHVRSSTGISAIERFVFGRLASIRKE